MPGKTAFEKIIATHRIKTLSDGSLALRLDRIWCHEITTPNAILDAQFRGADVVADPNRIKALIDHVSPAKDRATAVQGKILRDWCQLHGIEFLDIGRNGICHAMIPEKGWIRPGEIGVMGDSHTCTHGAFCAFTAGVGTTDLEAAIMTGLWICPPQQVIRVNFVGTLPNNIFAKDLILTLIQRLGVKGATNAVLEIGGPVIEELSLEARLTITNMTVEAGATSGLIPVDSTTIGYLWPTLREEFSSPEKALAELSRWNSDPDCVHSRVVTIDVTDLKPVITQNYSPGDVVPVENLAGKPVNQVYLGSCTNGRLEDLRIAADVMRKLDRPVAPNIRCVIVPATPHIWQQANQEGLIEIFMKAGCCVTNPTCGACLGMSCGVLAPGEICVSTTNRNFSGRMGEGGMVHLASPATAALTAIQGKITVPDRHLLESYHHYRTSPQVQFSEWPSQPPAKINYAKLAAKQLGKARDFSGRVFYLPEANVDTDQIIPARYLSEVEKELFGQHCLEDAKLTADQRLRLHQCQIIVARENFGSGSSREQAPWAFEAAGIYCVIAPSFARIFHRNMFNNGLLCITLPRAVVLELLNEQPAEIKVSLAPDLNGGEVEWVRQNKHLRIEKFILTELERRLIDNGGGIGVMLNLAAELL